MDLLKLYKFQSDNKCIGDQQNSKPEVGIFVQK
jgi:hypothetical protein